MKKKIILGKFIFIAILSSQIIIFTHVLSSGEEYEEFWATKNGKAEQPFKKFNEEIFSNIAFSGICAERDDYKGNHSKSAKMIKVKINNPISKIDSIPAVIPSVYDFRVNPIKIYFTSDVQSISIDSINSITGSKVEKRLGEIFVRLYFKNRNEFQKIYYSSSHKYFCEEK